MFYTMLIYNVKIIIGFSPKCYNYYFTPHISLECLYIFAVNNEENAPEIY